MTDEPETLLAVDVGTGTQDLLFVERDGSTGSGEEQARTSPTENTPKLVLPSPTVLKAREVRGTEGDLHLSGSTMGGGPVVRAILERAEEKRVTATPEAARTIRDDLDRVREKGVEVVEEGPEGSSEVRLADLEPERLRGGLERLGLEFPSRVAVAVQDHGVAPEGVSDRENRIHRFRETMGESGAEPSEFVHRSPDSGFTRVSAALESIGEAGLKGFVTDTKMAAVAGADPEGEAALVADVGNGHTLLALTDDEGRVCSLTEHHTSQLHPGKAEHLIERLVDGSLTHEEVFEDGGHGACRAWTPEPERFVKTGPKRGLLDDVSVEFETAAPIGDVMMPGPVGLYRMGKEL